MNPESLFYPFQIDSRKLDITELSLDEIVVEAFACGPPTLRKIPKVYLSGTLKVFIFLTYFTTCSVYTVTIATNICQVYQHQTGGQIEIRVAIACTLLPLLLLSYIPDLKQLTPVSIVANIIFLTGLVITLYYLFSDTPSVADRPLVGEITRIPFLVSVVVFAMETVGVIMPLENSMQTPQSMLGPCGVISQASIMVLFLYILVGFFGYVKYGSATKGSVILNLPVEEIPAQAVKVLLAMGILCTYGLSFIVCLEVVWHAIVERFTMKRPLIANYILRTVLVTGSVLLAVAVPTIPPLVALLGAFSISFIGLITPVSGRFCSSLKVKSRQIFKCAIHIHIFHFLASKSA